MTPNKNLHAGFRPTSIKILMYLRHIEETALAGGDDALSRIAIDASTATALILARPMDWNASKDEIAALFKDPIFSRPLPSEVS